MNILVTGGAGYIGSVTVQRLIEAGHTPIVLDDFSMSSQSAVPEGVRVIEGKVGDFGRLVHADDHIDAVLHLAARISVAESMREPELYWQNNVVETLAMLGAMRALGITRLVFASTAAVYGNPETIPITEDAPTKPTSTYGMTKLAIDMAISGEALSHGLAACSVRFFNVAGAYGNAGERHPDETHLIPLALAAANGDLDALSLYGTDYPTKDGTCVRDYIHVADLADAMILALDNLTSSKHTVYNLGSTRGFTNREVLEAVERVTGKAVPFDEAPRRDGDPAVLVASNDLARKELGWTPQRSDLDTMATDARDFYRQNLTS